MSTLRNAIEVGGLLVAAGFVDRAWTGIAERNAQAVLDSQKQQELLEASLQQKSSLEQALAKAEAIAASLQASNTSSAGTSVQGTYTSTSFHDAPAPQFDSSHAGFTMIVRDHPAIGACVPWLPWIVALLVMLTLTYHLIRSHRRGKDLESELQGAYEVSAEKIAHDRTYTTRLEDSASNALAMLAAARQNNYVLEDKLGEEQQANSNHVETIDDLRQQQSKTAEETKACFAGLAQEMNKHITELSKAKADAVHKAEEAENNAKSLGSRLSAAHDRISALEKEASSKQANETIQKRTIELNKKQMEELRKQQKTAATRIQDLESNVGELKDQLEESGEKATQSEAAEENLRACLADTDDLWREEHQKVLKLEEEASNKADADNRKKADIEDLKLRITQLEGVMADVASAQEQQQGNRQDQGDQEWSKSGSDDQISNFKDHSDSLNQSQLPMIDQGTAEETRNESLVFEAAQAVEEAQPIGTSPHRTTTQDEAEPTKADTQTLDTKSAAGDSENEDTEGEETDVEDAHPNSAASDKKKKRKKRGKKKKKSEKTAARKEREAQLLAEEAKAAADSTSEQREGSALSSVIPEEPEEPEAPEETEQTPSMADETSSESQIGAETPEAIQTAKDKPATSAQAVETKTKTGEVAVQKPAKSRRHGVRNGRGPLISGAEKKRRRAARKAAEEQEAMALGDQSGQVEGSRLDEDLSEDEELVGEGSMEGSMSGSIAE